jgi:sec-independent protein translocase protein TatA
MGIGNPVHLIFLAAIALIVLGPKRLPELARSLGNGMREFRESMSEAAGHEEHASPPAVPGQAQLVATTTSEPAPSESSPHVEDAAQAQAAAIHADASAKPPASVA